MLLTCKPYFCSQLTFGGIVHLVIDIAEFINEDIAVSLLE